MKLQDFLDNPTKVRNLTTEYNGESISFHIRELTAGDRESLSGVHNYLLQAKREQDETGNVQIDADALKNLYILRASTCALTLCNAEGERLFADVEEFNNKVPAKLCDAMYEAIQAYHEDDDPVGNYEAPTA